MKDIISDILGSYIMSGPGQTLNNWYVDIWKSRAHLTPEGKAALTPENLLFLTPVKS